MKTLGKLLCLIAIATISASGVAQASVQPSVDEAAATALQCLVKPDGKLVFPAWRLAKNDGSSAIVRARLVFDSADSTPRITFLNPLTHVEDQNAILEYARGYRLPCWTPELGKISAIQEFVFHATADAEGRPLFPEDPQATALACLKFPEYQPRLSQPIDSTVLAFVFIRFVGDGSAAPQYKIYSRRPMSDRYKRVIANFVEHYRLPCRQAHEPVVTAIQRFVFQSHSEPPTTAAFKQRQLPLADFLRLVKLPSENVRFDTTEMSCPFQLHWTSMQPFMRNLVRQIGVTDASRTAFTAWLASIRLALTESQEDQLNGSALVIDVPCTVIDLTKETS